MPSNNSVTTTLSSSQLLSSSTNSTSSRQGSSQISKIYRQASTLFLTRRLPESLSTILPLITPPTEHDINSIVSSTEPAPIARASRTTRIKAWSLYLTILNAVVELEPEEGKHAFGTQEWRALVSKVRGGDVWEEVVTNGYGGIEGDVDSDVVINLATLLLAHARSQKVNQQRLENYLAASSRPNLEMPERIPSPQEWTHSRRRMSPTSANGTDTPRDLNARVKILELYTLHVLLRNDEWQYARDFISMSEILDEERREAFLQALQSLQDEQRETQKREREVERREEEQLQRDIEEARRKRAENEERERRQFEQDRLSSKTATSEVDYGIERTHPTGSINGFVNAHSAKGGSKSRRGNTASVSHSTRPSVVGDKNVPPNLVQRTRIFLTNLRKLLDVMTGSLKGSPMYPLQILAFIIALLLILGRRDIKERVKRIMGTGWNKVRATAGMGVKVSYI